MEIKIRLSTGKEISLLPNEMKELLRAMQWQEQVPVYVPPVQVIPDWTVRPWQQPWYIGTPTITCESTPMAHGELLSLALEARESCLGMSTEYIADRLSSLTCGCVD